MNTNPALYTSAPGVNIVHTAPPNMAGPTANPRVVFPSPYNATAPRAGFTYPQGCGSMGYGTPYGAPQGIYPNASGTIGYPPRAAEPVSGPYQGAHAGPSPIRYVTVTRATGIGAALAAGATIVFATPSTPARVIYPSQQTAAPTSGVNIIRPTPRYGVPMPGTKIVPPRQNGPPPTFTGKAFHPVTRATAPRPRGPAPSSDVEIIHPTPRYGVPMPGAKIVPPRQNGPPPTFTGKAFHSVPRATVQTSMAQANQPIPSIWNTVTSPVSGMKTPSASPPSSVWDISSPDAVSASSTSGVHILSQLRVGSPLTTNDTVAPALKVGDVGLASKDTTPSSCVSYSGKAGKAFHSVPRATVQTSMAQANQAIPSIWNTVTSPVSVKKSPSASPPSTVWDVSSPDVSASSTSGVHILSQLRVRAPLTSDDTVAPALNVGKVGLASKDATPCSCVSYFLQQMSSVRFALVTTSLVELSRPYIPYTRVIKEGRRSCRAVIMPVADVMCIHRELKHPYVTCDRMRKRGEKLARMSQRFYNTQRLYVHPFQMAAPYTPPYPAHVQRIYYVVPSAVYMASQTAQRNTPASAEPVAAAPASSSEVYDETSSRATGITGNNRLSMHITTRTSKRKTTMSTKIVAAPTSDATSSHGGSTTYGTWSVTTTVETKIATATQEVTQNVMLPPCGLPTPQACISSSPETSLLTSEATTVIKPQSCRFSPITSAWSESPLMTSAISDDRPASVSPPSRPWERNASPNESPTTSDIHLRAGTLISQEDNAQCLTKCTTQAADETLNPVVKRCDSITEFKEEKANASKEVCDRKALEASQSAPDCTKPVQSEGETLEVIQPDPDCTNPVQSEGETLEVLQAHPDCTNPVQSETNTLEVIQPDPDCTNPVQSEAETLEVIQPDPDCTNPVQSVGETLEVIQADPDCTNPVQSEGETLEVIQAHTDCTNPVQSEAETLEAIQADPDCTNPVQSVGETLGVIQPDPDCTNPVQSVGETLEVIQADPDCTNPVQSETNTLEVIQTDPDCTNPVQSERNTLEVIQLDPDCTNPVQSEGETLEVIQPDPDCTNHVQSEALGAIAEQTKHLHDEEKAMEAIQLDTECTKHVDSEEEDIEANKLDAESTVHEQHEESLEINQPNADGANSAARENPPEPVQDADQVQVEQIVPVINNGQNDIPAGGEREDNETGAVSLEEHFDYPSLLISFFFGRD